MFKNTFINFKKQALVSIFLITNITVRFQMQFWIDNWNICKIKHIYFNLIIVTEKLKFEAFIDPENEYANHDKFSQVRKKWFKKTRNYRFFFLLFFIN